MIMWLYRVLFIDKLKTRYRKIGWDWVKIALLNGWKLLHSVTFTNNQDPTTAMASLKQHEPRLYQLEFKVITYSCAVL